MKYGLLLSAVILVVAPSAPADTPAYAHCGTYDSYILLYKSIQKFEELGKLHCGESVAITGRDGDYSQVRTADGRLGWVPSSDLSFTAPPPQPAITFGWTETRKPEPAPEPPVSHPAEQVPVPAPAQASVEAPVPTPAQSSVEAADQTNEPTTAPAIVQPPPQASAQPAAAVFVPIADQPIEPTVAARPNESAPLLTNVSVMKMQGAHLSPESIIARINNSRCDFDTSSAALHRLKLSNVSDRIILAMMHAPAAFPALPPDAAQSVEVKIPNQTPVQVALSGDVSADDLQEGSVVEMFVVQPVMLNGVTLFPKGAEARARIMAVRRATLGSSAQVVWFMQDITAASGDRVPASFAATQNSKAAVGNFAGYPFFLTEFRKGAPAIAASSDQYTAVVDGSIPVRVPRPLIADQAVTGTPAQIQSQAQPQPSVQLAPAVNTSVVFPSVVQAPDPEPSVKP